MGYEAFAPKHYRYHTGDDHGVNRDIIVRVNLHQVLILRTYSSFAYLAVGGLH